MIFVVTQLKWSTESAFQASPAAHRVAYSGSIGDSQLVSLALSEMDAPSSASCFVFFFLSSALVLLRTVARWTLTGDSPADLSAFRGYQRCALVCPTPYATGWESAREARERKSAVS